MFGRLNIFNRNRDDKSQAIDVQEQCKYCPSCGDEYRAEIIRCAACDVDLVSGDEKGSVNGVGNGEVAREVVSITAGDELVTIKKAGLADVKALQRLLLKEGIDALVAGDGADCAKGRCNSSAFDLNVRKVDFADALIVLKKEFSRTTALAEHDFSGSAEAVFDEHSGRVNCPACGSTFVPEEETVCPECGLCF